MTNNWLSTRTYIAALIQL